MKKVALNIKINVPDNFECGDCKNCPICFKKTFNYKPQVEFSCKLRYDEATCPLEAEERERK